jgi:hypothetical protein
MAFGWGDAISGVLQIGGQLLSHKAKSDENKQVEKASQAEAEGIYEASLAQKNELYQQASDLDEMARREAIAASRKSYQIQRAGYEAASTALTNYAGSGVVAGEGSAGLVPAHIVGAAAEDVYTNIANANDQIFQIQSQAAANRRQGDTKLAAGLLARDSGSDSATAAAKSINQANWAGTLMGVGSTVSSHGWFD